MAFEKARQEMANHYHSTNFEDKKFYAGDLSVESQTDEAMTVKLKTIVGKPGDGTAEEVYCNRFGISDNWMAVNSVGRCDGTLVGDDADSRITEVLNKYYSLEHPPVPAAFYIINFINIETKSGNSIDHPEYMWSGEENECVVFSEMNSYYCNMVGIVDSETPEEKAFVSFSMADVFLGGVNSVYIWDYKTTYGTPVTILQPPTDPDFHGNINPALNYIEP